MQTPIMERVNAIPLLITLDIRCTEIGSDFCRMEVTVAEKHLNFYGGAHGGLLATLVDTVCFFAEPLLPAGRTLTTSQLTVNYLRPAALGDHLIAEAKILHLGRRTVHVDVTVRNQHDALVVHGTGSLLEVSPA
ncbi:MAG: PaaI family thioesterase [Desulfuromonas sp.]|nr:MAG: PaaI family thioesterase [Desulfuromonas sp.]